MKKITKLIFCCLVSIVMVATGGGRITEAGVEAEHLRIIYGGGLKGNLRPCG